MRAVWTLITLLAALGGAASAALLLGVDWGFGTGAIEATCGPAGGCARIAASPWAVFPPRVGPLGGELARVPVALIALAHFLIVLLHTVFTGRSPWSSALLGLAGSAVYLALSALALPTICALCLVSHAANVLLFCAALARRRLVDGPQRSGPRGALAVALALATTLWFVDATRPDLHKLHAIHRGARTALADPTRAAQFDRLLVPEALRHPATASEGAEAAHQLVVFSDPECPACRAFERFLREHLLPVADGRLEVWLHLYPLTDIHPQAFEISRSLEAAQLQGAFDPAMAAVTSQVRGSDHDPRALAVELGLDVDRFLADRLAPLVDDRLARARLAARALDVSQVPAVFLDRARIDPRVHTNRAFWELLIGD